MMDLARDCRLIFRFWRASSSLRSRSAKMSRWAPGKPIGRGDIADGRMQPHGVVMVNEAFNKSCGIRLGKRATRPEAISFKALVPAFCHDVLRSKCRRVNGHPYAPSLPVPKTTYEPPYSTFTEFCKAWVQYDQYDTRPRWDTAQACSTGSSITQYTQAQTSGAVRRTEAGHR